MRGRTQIAAVLRACGATAYLLILPALSGCALNQQVEAASAAYSEVHYDSRDRRVFENILRSSFNFPVHFSDISNIHGVLGASSGFQGTLPFGSPHTGATTRGGLQLSFGSSSSPTFDVNSLETQNFEQAITTPISPRVFKNFLDSGLDYRVAFLLFVSGVQYASRTGGKIVPNAFIFNSPESLHAVCYYDAPDDTTLPDAFHYHYQIFNRPGSCGTKPEEFEFSAFLRILNQIHPIYAHEFTVTSPFGPPVSSKISLKDLSGVDPGKFTFAPARKKNAVQLVAIDPSPRMALCESVADRYNLLNTAEDPVCNRSEVDKATLDRSGASESNSSPASISRDSAFTSGITLRSVAGMFKFLGEVVAYEHRNKGCITLDPKRGPATTRIPTCAGNVFFHVDSPARPGQLAMTWNGRTYGVGAGGQCGFGQSCDHSLEVINVLSLLLGLSTNPKDLLVTPSLQLLP